MNSVRRAQRERSAPAESSGVSGFHALTLSASAERAIPEPARSAAAVRLGNAGTHLEQRPGLRAELEIALAELTRTQQELELTRTTLELLREENELLRQSLRGMPVSGAISVAARVAPSDDEFEVVGLDSLEFDRPQIDVAELADSELDGVDLDDAELAGRELGRELAVAELNGLELEQTGRELDISPPLRVGVPRELGVEAQGDYPILRNLVLSTGVTAAGSDRRDHLRHGCEIEVEFADESHFFAGLTQDISRGGLFVSTYHLLPVGSRLNLRFELPNGARIEVLGQVRWVLDSDADSRPGIGIEFVEAPPEVLDSIAAFCAARPPLYFDTVAPAAP